MKTCHPCFLEYCLEMAMNRSQKLALQLSSLQMYQETDPQTNRLLLRNYRTKA